MIWFSVQGRVRVEDKVMVRVESKFRVGSS